MADIISFHSECFDFEAMVSEVEILIPKYMDALEEIKDEDQLHKLAGQVKNIAAYWERLSQLFDAFAAHDGEEDMGINFQNVQLNTMQTELDALESVYLRVHNHICFDAAKDIDPIFWELSKTILKRMSTILKKLGFDENHKDRMFVKDMQLKNSERELRSGIIKSTYKEA